MKIALIYPPVSTIERYGRDIGEIGGRQAPLGLMYLSSFMKESGHDVLLIDALAEDLSDDEILSRIRAFSPQITGISSTSVALRNSQHLAELIKKKTNAVTVIGGAHISSAPEDLASMDFFDFGICGEGEIPFKKLVEALEKNKIDFSSVPNLIWKKDGKLIQNSRANRIEDLNTLPHPDRKALKDIRLYRPPIMCYMKEPVVSMITSRGCPYQCIFCDKAVFGSKVRFFSNDYVMQEIDEIKSVFAAREISFVDDTFACNKERFTDLLMRMRKEAKIPWTCMANANDLDEDIIKLMKEAGCWQTAIGIESGDDRILKIIRKKTDTTKIAKIANTAHKYGIFVKGFFMLGHPEETKESIDRTRNFALSLPLTDVTCTIATPIRGSEFYKMAESGKYGIFYKDLDQSQFNYWKPVFIPQGLDAETLLREQKRFFISFYLRFSIIIRQLKKIRSPVILFRLLHTILKLLFSYLK